MGKIDRFEDLEIWQKAIQIAVRIYELSNKGELKNDFGMKDQIRRSSTSISNNIAEGFESNSNKNFVRYLGFAKSSAGELRSQLYLLYHVNLISEEFYNDTYSDLVQLSKEIMGFIKYLRKFEKEKSLN